MNLFQRAVSAIPSSFSDDAPRGIGSEAALDYHVAWTSLWDPRVLACLQFVPETWRADAGGKDLENALIVCSEVVRARIDTPSLERLAVGNCVLISTQHQPRQEVVHGLLAAIASRAQEAVASKPDDAGDELATIHSIAGVGDAQCALLQDFYAFGFMVAQVQIMARKLRYAFNLDWMIVSDQILQAAKASIAGDTEEADRWLAAAFDSLSQERDRYCSQHGNVIDLVLVAETTLGDSLQRQLESDHPTSWFATTATLEKWRDANPVAWRSLLGRVEEQSACLVGGMREELPHPYLVESSLYRSIQRGASDAVRLGIRPYATWMRMAPGITVGIPEAAKAFGFRGAIVAALGGGGLPDKEHAKIRWQATGESPSLDCILGHVLDAADSESLLTLGAAMAAQLDYHQVPTLVLAHWPARVSPIFEDLRIAMRRTPAIGKWIDADQYFATTSQPYWTDAFQSHQFRMPLPADVLSKHALHGWMVRNQRRLHALDRMESLCRLWRQIPMATAGSNSSAPSEPLEDCLEAVTQLQGECDGLGFRGEEDERALDARVDGLRNRIAHAMHGRIPDSPAIVAFNDASHPQRLFCRGVPGEIVAQQASRVVSVGNDQRVATGGSASASGAVASCVVVDVPPFGFCELPVRSSHASSAAAGASKQSAAASTKPTGWLSRVFGARGSIALPDGTLANEFMEIQIDTQRGHLKSMYVANQRGNRLSGMVSLIPRPFDVSHKIEDSEFVGVQQAKWRILESGNTCGSIEVSGVLGVSTVQADASRANCRIVYTLWHGARWLDVNIELEALDPLAVYPVWRMVWPSQAASIAAWQNGHRGKLPGALQGAIELIEVDDAEHKVHFATCGLSAHRKHGPNMLISALPLGRDGGTRVRFAVGMDWPRPWETAIDRMLEPWVSHREDALMSAGQRSGERQASRSSDGAWLAQANLPNIRFQWVDPEPALTVSSSSETAEKPADAASSEDASASLFSAVNEESVRADACWWMVETAGRSGTVKLSCMKNVKRAWRVDARGMECDRLQIDSGAVVVAFRAWERSRIAVCFA